MSVSCNARFVLLYISALFKFFIPSSAKSQRGYIHVITLPFVRPQYFVHVKTLNKIVNRNGKCFKETTTQPKSGKQLTTRKSLHPEPSCSWPLNNNVYQRNGRHTKLRNIIKEFVGYKTGQAETYCFSLWCFLSLRYNPRFNFQFYDNDNCLYFTRSSTCSIHPRFTWHCTCMHSGHMQI